MLKARPRQSHKKGAPATPKTLFFSVGRVNIVCAGVIEGKRGRKMKDQKLFLGLLCGGGQISGYLWLNAGTKKKKFPIHLALSKEGSDEIKHFFKRSLLLLQSASYLISYSCLKQRILKSDLKRTEGRRRKK